MVKGDGSQFYIPMEHHTQQINILTRPEIPPYEKESLVYKSPDDMLRKALILASLLKDSAAQNNKDQAFVSTGDFSSPVLPSTSLSAVS